MLKIAEAWRTEDTDKFFYEIEEKKMIKSKAIGWTLLDGPQD